MTWLSDQQRKLIAVAIASVFGALFIVSSYVSYPTRIDSAASLEGNVGNRVKFEATFNGFTKLGEVILLGGTALVMQTRPTGRFDWPKSGDTIDVAGRLERRHDGKFDFILRDASWTIKSQRND